MVRRVRIREDEQAEAAETQIDPARAGRLPRGARGGRRAATGASRRDSRSSARPRGSTRRPPPSTHGPAAGDPRQRRGGDRRDGDRARPAASTTRRAASRSPRSATGATAGTLLKPRACYICKQPLHARRRLLPPALPALRGQAPRNGATRAPTSPASARCSPAAARRSACTSRCGCCATARTRRSRRASRATPCAASRAMPDSARVARPPARRRHRPARPGAGGRRSPTRSPRRARSTSSSTTPRRRCAARPTRTRRSSRPSRRRCRTGPLPQLVTFGRTHDAHPHALRAPRRAQPHPGRRRRQALAERSRSTAGSASLERLAAGTAIDAGGLVPDLHDVNCWMQHVDEVDPLEMLEVQLCNTTAPFILVSRLRPSLAASPARRKYVVNVSAMEGAFSRGYKGPGHPHTNMAKAALNMLTRTSAREMLETDGILMTSVDTGWITDERPHPHQGAPRRGGLPRAARPRRRRRPRLRPDRARRGRRGPLRRAS